MFDHYRRSHPTLSPLKQALYLNGALGAKARELFLSLEQRVESIMYPLLPEFHYTLIQSHNVENCMYVTEQKKVKALLGSWTSFCGCKISVVVVSPEADRDSPLVFLLLLSLRSPMIHLDWLKRAGSRMVWCPVQHRSPGIKQGTKTARFMSSVLWCAQSVKNNKKIIKISAPNQLMDDCPEGKRGQ